ncbi:hypothetical protein DFH06DRAFT_1352756 [Mycena polygramma]|nr:hypothetical protein DFH06DRAFT_1352756 [Mycena polygramma]
MPATRRTRRQRPTKSPLPRITDPYAPRGEDDPLPVTAEKVAEERERVTANKRVCRLLRKHERTVAASASIPNDAERQEKTSETWVDHFMAVREYECRYGKFVPDAENAAWQARKKPRMEELYKLRAVAQDVYDYNHIAVVIYLTRERAFAEDFGHDFSGYDGLDEHFKQLEAYADSAAHLRQWKKNDLVAMIAEAERPFTFEIHNPYPDGHPRREDFDAKMRGRAANILAPHLLAAWPATVMDVFPFQMRNTWAGWERGRANGGELVLHEYYKLQYTRDGLHNMELYHWEAANDAVGEKREYTHCPFVPRPALW